MYMLGFGTRTKAGEWWQHGMRLRTIDAGRLYVHMYMDLGRCLCVCERVSE